VTVASSQVRTRCAWPATASASEEPSVPRSRLSGGGPPSDEGVDQGLAFLLIENLAVSVRTKMTGQDGLKPGGGHAAFLRHCDKFGKRRQPCARSASEVRMGSFAD